MTADMAALGRRAVACPGWRWLPGMLTVGSVRLSMPMADPRRIRGIDDYGDVVVELLDDLGLPDLSDAATVGCLLALVREAHDDPTAYTEPTSSSRTSPWRCAAGPMLTAAQPTEAEALVVALEAA